MTRSVEQITADITKLREELTTAAQDAFKEGARNFFDKYPSLTSFGWDQYAPYFNDGEPCVFYVHDYTLRINGFNPEYDEGDDEDEEGNPIEDDRAGWKYVGGGAGYTHETTPWKGQAYTEIQHFINALPEDVMKDTFGDDVRVIVKRSGDVETDYVEHD